MSSETRAAARPSVRPDDTTVVATCRQAARASGPLGVVALISFIGSLVATGGDSLELATSPFSIVASALGVTALIALTIGMFSVAAISPCCRRVQAGSAG